MHLPGKLLSLKENQTLAMGKNEGLIMDTVWLGRTRACGMLAHFLQHGKGGKLT